MDTELASNQNDGISAFVLCILGTLEEALPS